MTRGFTAQQPAALCQLFHDITVTDLGTHERNLFALKCLLQAKVRHQCTNHTTLEFTLRTEVRGDDVEQLIAIHFNTGMINHNDAVTVTIQRDTQIGSFSYNPLSAGVRSKSHRIRR